MSREHELDDCVLQTSGERSPTLSSPALSGRMRSEASLAERFESSKSELGRSGDKTRKSTVSGKFVKAKTATLNDGYFADTSSFCGVLKGIAVYCSTSRTVANLMAAIVLTDAICTCIDVDARAAAEEPPPATQLIADLCLLVYSLETICLLTAKGSEVLRDWMVITDLVVIACGYLETILHHAGYGQFLQQFGLFRMLRLVRILRLTRLLRRTRGFRELQKLVRMMATCIKTLGWSLVFLFIIMTIWALLIVEVVHPLMKTDDLAYAFETEGCGDRCLRATSTVLHANLLLFKTVIAGDSWGEIAVPVIEAFPLTAIIFAGSLLTLVFGVLNLIVAVVVDTFAEARQRDVLNLAEEMEYNHAADQKFLENIFQRIDADGSGQVTFEELLEGARKDPEFQSRLRVMDIDESDLLQLFEMIDVNGEGEIAAAEFIAPLTRWVHDSKTAPRFIKYNVLRSLTRQEELYDLTKTYFDILDTRIQELSDSLARVAPGPIGMLAQAGLSSIGLQSVETEEMECADGGAELAEAQEVDAEVEQPHASKPALLGSQSEVRAGVRQGSSELQEALKLAVGSLEAVVENALKDGKAGALQPARPHKRSSRRVPTFPELENNIFERNRRASRAGSKEEVSPGPSAPGPSGSSQTSKALPAPATAPKFKFQRCPVGFFNAPGAGQPAEAISERWRRVSHSDDGGDSRDTSTWRRHDPIASIDVGALRKLHASRAPPTEPSPNERRRRLSSN